jgi:hypothetical protein
MLAASQANLDRSEAAIHRQRERSKRQQGEVDREVAATRRGFADPAAPRGERGEPVVGRAEELRQRLLQMAGDFAQVEQLIAELHQRKETDDPDKRARYLEIAEQAREVAQNARSVAERLAPQPTEPAT